MKIRIFPKLKTRQKIVFSVIFLTLWYIFLQRIDIVALFDLQNSSIDFLKPILIGAMSFLLTYWVSEFRISGERFITILGFPALGSMVFSLFVELIVSSIFGQLGILSFILFTGVIYAFFVYILFLTSNVLNLAHLDDIPLGQAGRAAYFIINMIIQYLLFIMILSNDLFIVIQIGLVFCSSFLMITSTLWTIKLKASKRVLVAVAISTLLSFTTLVLSTWPIEVTFMSFVLLIFLYITLGIALETREKFSQWIWIEYGLLFLIIFLILLITSNWGINGRLI